MKKNILFLTTVFAASGLLGSRTAAEEGAYRQIPEKTVEVTGDILNIRTGPGLSYPVTGTVRKGEELTVLGAFDQWYLVQLANGSVGIVSGQFTKTASLHMQETSQGDGESESHPSGEGDEGLLFRLANRDREANGLPPFIWDENLNNIALLKARDMRDNNYFGHNSDHYGTPFTMLKQMGVLYKSASENIAGNESVERAHAKIMASPAHRSNILNARYDKMGVGIVDSDIYGKIIVQLFIEE